MSSLMCMAEKTKIPTQTIRVTNDTARLLHTLAAWEDMSIAEYSTATLDDLLRERIALMADSGSKARTKPKRE